MTLKRSHKKPQSRNLPFELLSLPNELLLIIARNLDAKDIGSLILANHHLSSLLTQIYHRLAIDRHIAKRRTIHWAASKGYNQPIRLFLNRGASVNKKSLTRPYLGTALHCAVINGHESTVRFLLDVGANPNVLSRDITARQKNWRGRVIRVGETTPLHYAVKKGLKRIVLMLLDAGADIDAQDTRYKQTALHIAARSRCGDILKLLLQRGANVNILDARILGWPSSYRFFKEQITIPAGVARIGGNTSLHYATISENTNNVRMLLDWGAGIDAQEMNTGKTALHISTLKNNEEVTKVLLEKGADPSIEDYQGQKPLDYVWPWY